MRKSKHELRREIERLENQLEKRTDEPYSLDELEDLPASVLTPTQREYLYGESDKDGSAERALRARIRRRVNAGVLDLMVAGRGLEPGDAETISERTDDSGIDEAIEFLDSLKSE